ncbi:hypothetical protein FRAAL0813 [Frankia alni ACN14a]|uniref:Uncharacterized protein n=1 Tax=Frankia alni (strain DSM 45986 / CECT 9034 / ACN14a) TaxID=326424 RepID=Q0RSI0_FRAAA|nr:hypothetical protein FRAAL0813 [Frankia alni ACN14a]
MDLRLTKVGVALPIVSDRYRC